MSYYYPFGETVHPLVQQDRTPKKVFVLGVYASAVHARWKIGSKTIWEYVDIYGYGNSSESTIKNRKISVLPLAHPQTNRCIGRS